MTEPAIKVENLAKTFKVYEGKNDSIRALLMNTFQLGEKREINALQPVSFEVDKGEFFGIIGRNGSGKSTLLDLIMKTTKPDKGGKILTYGKMIKLSLGMGFDPGLTARENVYVNGSVLGLTLRKIGEKFADIFEFAELENFIDTKVKHYSKGMRARLAFAIALNVEADIFLFDEFFGGVGDLRFKKKSDEVFKNKFLNNKTLVIISHNLETIRKHCTRVLCLDKGKVIGIGPTEEMISIYKETIKKK